MTIAAAVFLRAWLGQTAAKLLDDLIEHYKHSRHLGKQVQPLLGEAGGQPISLDVTHYKRAVLDAVVAASLRKGHEVGTVRRPVQAGDAHRACACDAGQPAADDQARRISRAFRSNRSSITI